MACGMKLLISLLALPQLGDCVSLSHSSEAAPGKICLVESELLHFGTAQPPREDDSAKSVEWDAFVASKWGEEAPSFVQEGSHDHLAHGHKAHGHPPLSHHAFGREAHGQHASCQWLVHYDEWQVGFERHDFGVGSQHCLEACCHDPSCTGLQFNSNEKWQCYKYRHLPSALKARGADARPLGDGRWLAEAPPRWSVFVKAGHTALPTPPGGFVPSAKERAIEVTEALGLKYARKAQEVAGRTMCNWTVHYDVWTTRFDAGEYEGNNAMGGAHCLDACCQDPACRGLELESMEKYQCYKYSTVPPQLHGGRALGDGRWLQRLPGRWSVFVKHGVIMAPLVPQLPPGLPSLPPTASHPAPLRAQQEAPATTVPAPHVVPPGLAPLAACGAVIAFAVVTTSYFSEEAVIKRLFAKTARHGLEGFLKPEGRELMMRG